MGEEDVSGGFVIKKPQVGNFFVVLACCVFLTMFTCIKPFRVTVCCCEQDSNSQKLINELGNRTSVIYAIISKDIYHFFNRIDMSASLRLYWLQSRFI